MSTGMIPLNAAAPFDAIKHTRPCGSEYWSARELMPLLGYGGDWRNFAAAIGRARTAAVNQDLDTASLFVGVNENSGGRPREDLQLSRFACYLIAMNGDPRKTEVAAAQGYFAIRTREAETSTQQRAEIPQDYPAALEEAARQARRAIEAEAKVAELEPKASAFDAFLCGEGLYLVGTVGRMLGIGQTSMFRFLYEQRVLIRVGARSKQPYANPRFDGWFRVRTHDQEHTNGHASTTTMVTPVGAEGIRLLAIEKGLIEPQLIGLPAIQTKEITA